jgi:hypothetical protein
MDTVVPTGENHVVLSYAPQPLNGVAGAHPFMHMTASASGPVFASGIPPPEGAATVTSDATHPMNGVMGPLAFSSFMSNAPASGQPPLSAYGQTQASLASLGQQSTGPMPNGGPAPAGASSAPLHQRPESGGSG